MGKNQLNNKTQTNRIYKVFSTTENTIKQK